MEKNDREGRIIWIKAYKLTDAGKWFALLLAEEKEIYKKLADSLSIFRKCILFKILEAEKPEISLSKEEKARSWSSKSLCRKSHKHS
jgi:DNA replication initiation complex subunit (GINS family)